MRKILALAVLAVFALTFLVGCESETTVYSHEKTIHRTEPAETP